MSNTLKVALVQSDIAWLDVDSNLASLEEYFYINIVDKGYDLIVLPEMFTTGFGTKAAEIAEFMNGKSHKWLRNMALASGAMLMGSMPIREQQAIFNRLLCVSPNGDTQYYDKHHLFSFGQEDLAFKSGVKSLVINYKGFRIMPLICYDLRFPVWSRNQSTDPFDILIYIANWPSERRYAWQSLLKARAIENQCYVLGCNRSGTDGNGITYSGDSDVLDYEGKSICDFSGDHIVFTSVLRKDKILDFRTKFPFLNDSDPFQFL